MHGAFFVYEKAMVQNKQRTMPEYYG